MDEIEKAKIYLDYCITQIALRRDIYFFDMTIKQGFGTMDKIFPTLNVGIKKVGKDHLIMTIEEFFIKNNKYHCGSPAEEWCNRFKNILC